MGYNANILADSVSSQGHRLTTLEVTFPRYILPEFNTHRVFSRNSASSRAVPTEKKLRQILDNPVIPLEWGINRPGMQSGELIDPKEQEFAKANWLMARDYAVLGAVALIGGIQNIKDEGLALELADLNDHFGNETPFTELKDPIHKQFVNRLLEPFLWHTVIVTATEWDNFYALREHPAAQPEIRHTANLMHTAMIDSNPTYLYANEWHLPFVTEQEKASIAFEKLVKIAVARCARVSYETHDSKKIDYEKDFALHDTLKNSGHMSPFEHVARPMTDKEYAISEWSGNFKGWHQYRKDIPNEDNYANTYHISAD